MYYANNKISIQKPLFDLLFLIHIKMKEMVKNTDSEFSPLQIVVLRILVEEGEMSQIKLARKIGRDKSQTTRIIQDLEKKNILVKERSEMDRRSFILKLNKGVKEKTALIIQKEHELVTKMLAGVSKTDRKKLESLLTKMKENLNSCDEI